MKTWNKKRKPKHLGIAKKWVLDFSGIYYLKGYQHFIKKSIRYTFINNNYTLVNLRKINGLGVFDD